MGPTNYFGVELSFRYHRINGYLFVTIYLVMLVVMTRKVMQRIYGAVGPGGEILALGRARFAYPARASELAL